MVGLRTLTHARVTVFLNLVETCAKVSSSAWGLLIGHKGETFHVKFAIIYAQSKSKCSICRLDDWLIEGLIITCISSHVSHHMYLITCISSHVSHHMYLILVLSSYACMPSCGVFTKPVPRRVTTVGHWTGRRANVSVLMGLQEDHAKVSGLVYVHFTFVRTYVALNIRT